jgi:putative Mg2+ transporter-C (MgtC) family protein
MAIQPAVDAFQIGALLTTLIGVATAMGLGALIGIERQARQRTAGLRTNTLVAVGAAVFVDLANRLNGFPASVHVLAYVVSGVGFLGAGAIMKEGANITGLNTAATLWCSAAVGACAGAQQIGIAVIGALFVLMINTLLRPVAKRINRQPMLEAPTEAAYLIHVFVISDSAAQGVVVKRLMAWLRAIGCESREIEHDGFGDDRVLIQVTLMSSSIHAEELNAVTARASSLPGVAKAYWQIGMDE